MAKKRSKPEPKARKKVVNPKPVPPKDAFDSRRGPGNIRVLGKDEQSYEPGDPKRKDGFHTW